MAWGIFGTASLASASKAALTWVITNLGWAFVRTASGFVLFALWLAASRYGRIPLGRDPDPEETAYRAVQELTRRGV